MFIKQCRRILLNVQISFGILAMLAASDDNENYAPTPSEDCALQQKATIRLVHLLRAALTDQSCKLLEIFCPIF